MFYLYGHRAWSAAIQHILWSTGHVQRTTNHVSVAHRRSDEGGKFQGRQPLSEQGRLEGSRASDGFTEAIFLQIIPVRGSQTLLYVHLNLLYGKSSKLLCNLGYVN